ncbi:MAG TPA: hypothetical protein VGG93_12680 [Candidatus Udaeobacter sp.]|jgi:hypothetical protein
MVRESTLDFYRIAFEKIHRLAKLHLLVCPDSPIQYDESVVSADFKKLKRLYEMLSSGVTFWHPDEIRNAQICNKARHYNNTAKDEPRDVPRDHVIHGKLNVWRDWLQITLNAPPLQGLVDELRVARSKKYSGFAKVWKMWSGDIGRKFNDWYLEERRGLAKVLKQKLADAIRRHLEIRFGRREPSIEDMLPDHEERLAWNLKKILCDDNPDPACFVQVWEFLESDALDEVPFTRLSSLLFAGMAQQARGGKKCPGKHPFNDVDVVAAYLPYCDGMFLDNEMAALLHHNPIPERLNYPAQVFSLRTKTEFLAYLDEIEANASPLHIQTVREVYGSDWERPYVEVFHETFE